MKKEVLSHFSNPTLTLIGFLLFFACFIGVVIWTFRKSRKSHYDKMSKLPLKENGEAKDE